MVNYENGKVYKITHDLDPELVYYGSTTVGLAKRLSKHKEAYNRYLNGKTNFITSYKILDLGFEGLHITLIEECFCNNKEQLYAVERRIIENNKCVNKIIPGRSKKEYRIDNIDHIKHREKEYRIKNKEHIKEYYNKNIDKIKEQQKEKLTCECGSSFIKNGLSRHKKTNKHIAYVQNILIKI